MSARDIGSVVSVADSIAGSAQVNNDEVPGVYDDSRTGVFEALVAMTKATNAGKRKMKHFPNRMFINLVSSASSVDDSFYHLNSLENSEMESTATSTIKRPRMEVISLMQYICVIWCISKCVRICVTISQAIYGNAISK